MFVNFVLCLLNLIFVKLNKGGIMKILIIVSLAFWFLSCKDTSQYGTNTIRTNNAPKNPQTSTPNSSSGAQCDKSAYRGITCKSGQNRDKGFIDFLSGVIHTDEPEALGDLSCQPGNSNGILFQLKVALDGTFDPKGTPKTLIMQKDSSELTMLIYDSIAKTGSEEPMELVFKGLNGTVARNTAKLNFEYSGKYRETININLNGTFNEKVFKGTITFKNSKYVATNKAPGANGTLGDFSINTCAVFK